MRLTALTLNRYGNFAAERITFDPSPGTLNVLLAPNGGGKSVLRAAFCDLLFGIGGQTAMAFRYGYSGMRIMAEAVGPDNEPFAFARRKGTGNTLVDHNGGTLDPASIARLLGRTDRPRLERLFALDTDRLRQGEADLLASDGELGAALVSGAGGAHDLRALRKNLEETRDALAPARRSSQRPFYMALDRFVETRKRVDATLLRPDQWHTQESNCLAAEQRQIEQNRIADSESAEIARLERVRRVVPWLAARDTAAAWLDARADAPVLDLGLRARLADAREGMVLAEAAALREQEIAARLAGQVGEIVVDDRLLEEATEIGRLVEAGGAARKAMADLPSVTAQASALGATVAARLRELGSAFGVDRAAEAIPPRAAVNRVRRLIQVYAARHEAAQVVPGQIAALEREREAVAAQQQAMVAPADLSELEALVKEIRSDGDPARRQREVTLLQTETAETLAAAMARVPGWTSGDTELVALALLLPDTYDRHAAELAEKRAEAATRLEALQSARLARDEARQRLTAVTGSAALLDDDALTHVRGRRDSLWQLIYRRAFTADPPTLQEEQILTGPLPLPLAYERAVTVADEIADRMIREIELVERAQAAQAILLEAEARVHDAETRFGHAQQAQDAVDRAWRQLCGVLPLGDGPSSREVHAFLAARDRVIDARQAHLAAVAATSALAATQTDWLIRLCAMLASPCQSSLVVLLAEADQRLAKAQQAGLDRATLEARRAAAEKTLAEAQARQHQANDALAQWRDDWAQAMQELGRAPAEDPDVTNDVLLVYNELDQAQKELVELSARVDGMQRDNMRFAREAASLAARVAPDLDAADPILLVTALRQRLQLAEGYARQRDVLRTQLWCATASVASAEQQLADRRAELRAILELTGADTIEAAERRLALAAERAQHAANLAEAAAQLSEAGDFRPLAELRAEVAALPIEEIAGRFQRATERCQAAQVAAQQAAATASALAQQMHQAAAETGATDAAADQQAAVATIGRVLEEALVHHLAAEMLDRALAAVEQQGQPELLRRIGALFGRLTGGAYVRVMTEVGDDNLTRLILSQRDFPDERQAVRELSEGTRDQLYLALRLAAIEEHAAVAPPLPFIGDDILQTFDDERALAAMQVLREVSQQVQVILLTHHRHVLDLAAQLPAGSVHVCRIGAATLETV